MFERFTEKAIKVIMLAQEEARRLGHNFVGTEQILLGLIGEGTGVAAKVLKSMGVNLKDARVEVEKIIGRGSGFVAVEIPFTPRAKRVLELSLEEARQLGHNYIGTEHLLLGLIREGEGVAARVLENLGVDLAKVRTQVIRMLGETAEVSAGGGGGGAKGSTKTPTLDEFGNNLTQLATEAKLDPVVGRHNEIDRVIQILGRRTKNNPVLIGEPGVGKTAIAEGLQALSDGSLTNTRLTDQNGVVLGAATKDLDDAIDFVMTPHHRVELRFGGELGEVVAELVERWGFGGSLCTAATATGGDFSGFTEHADHLGAHLGQVDAKVLQHSGSYTFALTDQTEQQVLCADVVVTELTGLFQRQLQDALGAGCEGDLNSDKAGSTADDFLNFNPGILEVDPHGLEHLGGNPRSLANQAEEDLFGTNEVVTKSAGLFLGQHDHLDGLLGEAFKHRWANAVM